jgi:hypothetical protein
MSRKRLLALLCAPAVVGSALALAVATAPGAQALCTAQDQDAGLCPPPRTTTTRRTTPPTPPAAEPEATAEGQPAADKEPAPEVEPKKEQPE